LVEMKAFPEPTPPHSQGTTEGADGRLALARELHDGILQILTAASLQIEAAVRIGDRDPERALRMVQEIGEAISEEQRELRGYVNEMFGAETAFLDFPSRLEETLKGIRAIWGVEVEADADAMELTNGTARITIRIIQEAVANAVRHGRASRITVTVRKAVEGLTLTIGDNGGGFSFQGSFDDESLRAHRIGPVGLKRRIEAAGGSICIESGAEGATLLIRLPLSEESTP
jgi:signal transduction histidine kinase